MRKKKDYSHFFARSLGIIFSLPFILSFSLIGFILGFLLYTFINTNVIFSRDKSFV